jgi:hypothetical protein
VKGILDFVGAAVLFYGGLYALLATIGLVAYIVRRLFRHEEGDAEIPRYRRAGKTTAPVGRFHQFRRDWAMALLPVLMNRRLE